jgi:hypothetical protein
MKRGMRIRICGTWFAWMCAGVAQAQTAWIVTLRANRISANGSFVPTLTCTWGTGTASGSARVSWISPLTNTNGTPLTNLARFRVVYGTSASALNQSATVNNPGSTSHHISSLLPGTWFFAVRAVNSSNVESAISNVSSYNVPGGSSASAARTLSVSIAPAPRSAASRWAGPAARRFARA